MGSKKSNLYSLIYIFLLTVLSCKATQHSFSKKKKGEKQATKTNIDTFQLSYATDTLKYGKENIDVLVFLKNNIHYRDYRMPIFINFDLDSVLQITKPNSNGKLFKNCDSTIFIKYLDKAFYAHMMNQYFENKFIYYLYLYRTENKKYYFSFQFNKINGKLLEYYNYDISPIAKDNIQREIPKNLKK